MPETISTGDSTEPKKEGFFGNFINTLRKEIRDLSYVEIVTAVGDPKTDVNPDAEQVILGLKEADVKILARTRIELDGDIMVLLPGGENEGEIRINKEIMDIHKENVNMAVINWNNFMKNMLTALELLMSVTGLSKSQVLTQFDLPLPPSGTITPTPDKTTTTPTPDKTTTTSTSTKKSDTNKDNVNTEK